MANRRKKQGEKKFTNHPFRGLSLSTDEPGTPGPPASAVTPAAPERRADPPDDDAVLEMAMADVTPISGVRKLAEKRARPKPMLVESDEEALVMRQLDELVHGVASFDFTDTSEYIEAIQTGVDRRLLKKLRKGEFSYQAHLDLHGLNRRQARDKVGEFIRDSVLNHRKCVLIVHGRGLGSKDNIPVIKTKLAAWLTRGAIGKKVLAYTSAMPYDGGTGAVYVLLRTL
jgi:DNA-nicking Smr family endonuclease